MSTIFILPAIIHFMVKPGPPVQFSPIPRPLWEWLGSTPKAMECKITLILAGDSVIRKVNLLRKRIM